MGARLQGKVGAIPASYDGDIQGKGWPKRTEGPC